MPATDINITLGTAGHIDHGKTALVKSLTGCETDRLKEEKQRGMSIELGFAPCTLGAVQVGIVDVPGHEHFIRTMVAGASGMDGVILVVAADDGVMPQTREHLDILTLLGIQHGLVALTKVDRVAPEQVELARAEIQSLLQGTFLASAPILPISNVTGAGFAAFYEALFSLVQAIPPKRSDGVFRVPVERAFSVKGYGTVVAGIPVSGSACAGDEIVLLPGDLHGRIKRIEVYGRDSDRVQAGQCAAINVGHWEPQAIRRGDVLAAPGFFTPSLWYSARLRLLPRVKVALKNGAEVKFHTGTAEVIATLYAAGGDRVQSAEAAARDYLVQLKAKTPLVAGPGDHFILRTLSPVETIGGGTIIEAASGRLKRNRPELYADLQQRAEAVREDRRFVEYCVRKAPALGVAEPALAVRSKIPHARLRQILADLADQQAIFPVAGLYLHRDTAAETAERILGVVREFHRRMPESVGLPLEQLRQALPADKAVLEHLVARLQSEGRLVERGQRLAAAEHRSTFRDEDARRLDAIEALFREQGFHTPRPEEVAQQIGALPEKVDKLLTILCEHGRLIPVEKGLLFHVEAIERARTILVEHLRRAGRLESGQFKNLLGTTRKFAIPLLEYFDRTGVTRRVGNERYLKESRLTRKADDNDNR